jgi:hypothetical protein
MRNTFKFTLAVLAVAALAFGAYGLGSQSAFAGDEVPAAQPAAKTDAPATTAPAVTAPATKTETPFHSILMYVGSQVCGGECQCASTPEGSAKWAAWFDAKDAVMPGLKAALIADGWTKERFISFFATMAKASGSCSEGCDCEKCESKGECCGKCKSGEECDKGCECPNKAKAPAGDASGSASDASGDCPKGCCNGCKKDKADAAPTGDATSGSASDTAGDCPKGCCGGCAKKKDAAPAPTTNG